MRAGAQRKRKALDLGAGGSSASLALPSKSIDMETLRGFPYLSAMVCGQQGWPASHATRLLAEKSWGR
jgi:hypothetical protein